MCATRCAGDLLAVMDHAEDLHDTIRRDAIDDEMSWLADAMLTSDQAARRPEMEAPHAREVCQRARADQARDVANGVHSGEEQAVVAVGSLEAPLAGTLEEDSVDAIVSVPDQAVGH